MKIGLSSYSLNRAIKNGEMTWPEAIEWTARNGGEHFEVVPIGVDLTSDDALREAIVRSAKENGIALSSYTIGANFLTDTEEARQAEIARVKREVEVAAALGVTRMRHDAGSRPREETSTARFEADFPGLVDACRDVADHACRYGIVTSVENHGYHMQASERVHRLVLAVDRENFRTTIDIGNFLCADEDPIAAVKNNIGIASMVHFKDFYRRAPGSDPGAGWFPSRAGYHLRGAIVGQGDIPIPAVAAIVRESGFDGFVSLEFEGLEDCREGSRIGLENLRRYLMG